MDRKRHSSQTSPIELIKDVLILLLLCSAIFLLWEAQILVGFTSSLSQTSTTQPEITQIYQAQAEAARPIRMAAITGNNGIIYGLQYDDTSVDELFQLSSNILRETLGSLDAPITISQQEWKTMLSTAPGLYFDMAGEVPLSILSSWLSGQEELSLDDVPRRLLLTTTEEGLVALCYQSLDDVFYCCTTQVVDSSRLFAITDQFTSNGALFAFQADGFDAIDPYTLLSSYTPIQPSYLASNPISNDEDREDLLSLLNFDSYSSSIYTSTDGLGIVLRHDTDTLRIYGSGIVTYHGETGHSRYPVTTAYTEPTTFEIVESCRNLVTDAMSPFCGEARLQFLSLEWEDDHWIVNFSYTLNGSPVQFSDGSDAAQFIVKDGEITEFTLRFRNYISSDETVSLLPEHLAAAAMESLGYYGQELIISYYDSGTIYTYPSWVANER